MAATKRVEVTWQDQQNINKFSTLNQRLHEIEDQIVEAKRSIEDLDDAGAELVIADDDAPVRLRGGDGFLRVGKDDAEAELEALAHAARERLAGLQGELKGVQGGMAALKRELKAKFGDSINLEE